MHAGRSGRLLRILITGGGGFLGRALLEELRKPDCPLPAGRIRLFDLRAPAAKLRSGESYIAGDVRDMDRVRKAAAGVDLAFHAAALIDWGIADEGLLEAINVQGTANVIAACREAGVKALVYTGSEDAVYTGRAVVDADETTPCPPEHPSAYCRTKAEAEMLVLAADGVPVTSRTRHGPSRLRTTVIRPGGIWGEGDPYHISVLIRMARRTFFMPVGSGEAKCQHVYVGNAAHAHVLAARSLLSREKRAAGRVYFVTDGPAENFFRFMEPFVRGAGCRAAPGFLFLPAAPAYCLGWALEKTSALLRPRLRFEPAFTTFGVRYVTRDFTFSSRKIREELGYGPVYTLDEARARTIEHFRRFEPARRFVPPRFEGPGAGKSDDNNRREVSSMASLRRFMAKRCDMCPLCNYARSHPDTTVGKIMHWHGTWCPFWKAWQEVYGDAGKGKKSTSGS